MTQKIEKFGASSTALTERVVASANPETAMKFQAYAARIAEKSQALAAAGQETAGDGAYTAKLCADYDELQAIVDEAEKSGMLPAAAAKAKDGAPG